MLLMIDLASLGVDVLEVLLVLEMKMPGNEYILLSKLLFANTLLSLPMLLECPYVD